MILESGMHNASYLVSRHPCILLVVLVVRVLGTERDKLRLVPLLNCQTFSLVNKFTHLAKPMKSTCLVFM